MKATKLTLISFLTAVFLNSCGEKEEATTSLATVNGSPISEDVFRYWWDKQPPSEDTPEVREALLQKLIERSKLAQEARTAGLDKDPAVLESIESLLIAALKEKQLQPRIAEVKVSEEEIRDHFNASKSEAIDRFHPAVLWFDSRGQAPLAARYQMRLEKLRISQKDEAGDFGQLAITNTEHRSSRYRGGSFGWMTEGKQFDPVRNAVAEIASTLKPGELSPVIVRKEGVFLVRLIERRKEEGRSFEELRHSIELKLLARKRRELREEFNQSLSDSGDVMIHHENLLNLSDLPTRPDDSSQPFNPKTAQIK